jgi:sulfur-oxidizing protein SoxY
MDRRQWMLTGAALCAVSLRPASAASDDLQAAVRGFTDGQTPREGRVHLDIQPLVENGNAVPIAVSADSPMSEADHVDAIAIFNERNPQRDVAVFHFTPRSARASVSTRIRLATSQKVVAVARMSDGSFWSTSADVVVTIAGCVEE